MDNLWPVRKSTGNLICIGCSLSKTCLSPAMKMTGEGKKSILIIAEAPGKIEDEKGTQLVGESGQYLRKVLSSLGIDLDKDCWKDNAVRCRPPNNRTPDIKEIEACREHIKNTIKQIKPKKIFLFGKTAIESIIGMDGVDIGDVIKWVGKVIPNIKHNCWIFPMYHPSFLIRNKENTLLHNIFKKHLKDAINFDTSIEEGVFRNFVEKTIVLEDKESMKMLLNNILTSEKLIAFDYETTGLKPRGKEKVLCIGISTKPNIGYCFPVLRGNIEVLNLWKNILSDSSIKKVAHNIKFEHLWSLLYFGVEVKGWVWDTMLGTHVLDNTPKTAGLKFQTYINFGIGGYQIETRGGLQFPTREVMTYCAKDALYTFNLASIQRSKIRERGLIEPYTLLHNGTLTFADMEATGMKVDKEYLLGQIEKIKKEIESSKKEILKQEEIIEFNKEREQQLNIDSPMQIADFLYNFLNIPIQKKTEKGKGSVDEEVLEYIGTKYPTAQRILDYRKLKKIEGTYLKNLLSELEEDNIVRPSFNLGAVQTYRSSCTNPNIQNIPARDIKAQEYIRRSIVPREGNKLISADYSGIEVRVGCCYHQDPAMIKYLCDKTTDMHRDVTMDIYLLTKELVHKQIRYVGKNSFTFPQFYGSSWVNCAPNLWKNGKDIILPNGVKVLDHLSKKGIYNEEQFSLHIKKVEERFWNETFPIFTKWKKKVITEYERRMKLKMLSGFECIGYLDRNQIWNYPYQGAAFHILLWSLIHVNKFLKEGRFKTKTIGQIHDCILFDCFPIEEEEVKKNTERIMCKDVLNHFKWINIPLEIEWEEHQINGNWYD